MAREWSFPSRYASDAAKRRAAAIERDILSVKDGVGMTMSEARRRLEIRHDPKNGVARLLLDGSPVKVWRE